MHTKNKNLFGMAFAKPFNKKEQFFDVEVGDRFHLKSDKTRWKCIDIHTKTNIKGDLIERELVLQCSEPTLNHRGEEIFKKKFITHFATQYGEWAIIK